jgi:Zn-dependent peptidase ImmA (M78 family)
MTTARFNPEMLVIARESRGETQANVADAAGVTQGLISKAEHGLINEMSAEDLRAIARYLNYPEKLFIEPGRIRETGSACLYHRKRKTLPAKVLKKLDARMYLRNINVQKLLDGLELERDREFHTLDIDEFGGSPAAVARSLRAAWRIPDGPVPDLTALIESAGGIVLTEDFGHRKLFGMSCWTSRRVPLFFLNSEIPMADLRWTMAHELGHLTMHHNAPTGDPEAEADEFAGEFLAPEAYFRPACRRLTFDRLGNLKSFWRISMKAVIKRAHFVNAIDDATALRLYKQHSARGYNSVEPFDIPAEESTLVKTAIDVHMSDHGYSVNELAGAVLLSEAEFSSDFLKKPIFPPNVLSLFGNGSPPFPGQANF